MHWELSVLMIASCQCTDTHKFHCFLVLVVTVRVHHETVLHAKLMLTTTPLRQQSLMPATGISVNITTTICLKKVVHLMPNILCTLYMYQKI